MMPDMPSSPQQRRGVRRKGIVLGILLLILCVSPLAWVLLLHRLSAAAAQEIGGLLIIGAILWIIFAATGQTQ